MTTINTMKKAELRKKVKELLAERRGLKSVISRQRTELTKVETKGDPKATELLQQQQTAIEEALKLLEGILVGRFLC